MVVQLGGGPGLFFSVRLHGGPVRRWSSSLYRLLAFGGPANAGNCVFENDQVYSEVYAKKSVGIFTVYAKYI